MVWVCRRLNTYHAIGNVRIDSNSKFGCIIQIKFLHNKWATTTATTENQRKKKHTHTHKISSKIKKKSGINHYALNFCFFPFFFFFCLHISLRFTLCICTRWIKYVFHLFAVRHIILKWRMAGRNSEIVAQSVVIIGWKMYTKFSCG